MEKDGGCPNEQPDLCDVCSEALFKYKCPGVLCAQSMDAVPPGHQIACQMCLDVLIDAVGCSKRTCSLSCCKVHKERFQCAGKRRREVFVSTEAYKEETMMSDYRLLEEITSVKDGAERARLQPGQSGTNQRKGPRQMGGVIAAAKRAGVTLNLMSEGLFLYWCPGGSVSQCEVVHKHHKLDACRYGASETEHNPLPSFR